MLSLGGGVQSTVMALLAERGEMAAGKPDVAIFADTGWEPDTVYQHLEWLQTQLSYPILTVSCGHSLREDTAAHRNTSGHNFATIPYHTKMDNERSLSLRQCTSVYKIKPVHSAIRRMWQRRQMPSTPVVTQWLGISLDEVTRMKPSRVSWMIHTWPLIEARLTRGACQAWFQRHYPGQRLGKSACLGCPLHSDATWKALGSNPAVLADTVAVEKSMQRQAAQLGLRTPFLHRSCRPLDEVVLELQVRDASQLTLFAEGEGEGVCYV